MNNLKILRQKKGMTQAQVAEELQISQQAYANYETGRREPDYKTLLFLADFFDVSVDTLLGRETQKEDTLERVYFNFAKEAQENEIDPDDIKLAIETIKRLRGK